MNFLFLGNELTISEIFKYSNDDDMKRYQLQCASIWVTFNMYDHSQ